MIVVFHAMTELEQIIVSVSIVISVVALLGGFIWIASDMIIADRYGYDLTRKEIKKHIFIILWPIGLVVAFVWYVKKAIEAFKND